MPNKRISQFPVTTTIAGSDIFLINHLDTTSTISFSALSAAIATSIPSSGGGDATPIGTVCWFAASAAPTGYLECNGNAVSIALYPDLTTAIYCGDSKNATAQFGYRCTNSNTPSTSRSTAGQFIVLPDLRGEFIRGWDNGRGVDTDRVFGDSQDYATAIPKNTSPNRLLGDGTTENTFQHSTNPSSVGFARVTKTGENSTAVTIDPFDSGKQLDVLNVTVGDSETRPRNVALLPCIKARKTVTGNTVVPSTNTNSFTINGSMLAKAWVNFDGTGTNGTNQTIRSSYNVDRVYKNSTGVYTVVFSTPFENNSYIVNGIGGGNAGVDSHNNSISLHLNNVTTLSCEIFSDSGDGAEQDSQVICCTFYASGGDLTGSANVFDSTPVGTINYFAASAAPTGYLECSGGVVSISLYTDLYNVIGTRYNTGGEGAGNFRVPDLRGEFIRGWDNGRGVDTGRVFGTNQKGTLVGYDQGNDAVWNVTTITAFGSATQPIIGVDDYNISDYSGVRLKGANESSGRDLKGNETATEGYTGVTRPRNVALLPCIKAQKTVTGDVSTLNFIEKPASPTNGQVLTYNGSTSTWVASAAPSFTGSNQSLSTIGYQKLPGGLIMQWGSGTGGTAFTFPIPFPSACYSCVITPVGGFGGIGVGVGITFTTTGATPLTNAGNGNPTNSPITWIALGI